MFYSLLPVHFVFFLPLGFIGIYRWIWYFIKLIAYALYKPMKPKKNPTFTCKRDVTILVPTIDAGEEIKLAIKTWLKSEPYEVIFITNEETKPALLELARGADPSGNVVKVITVEKPNKRKQMVAGINEVKTQLIIFADDDVLWPSKMGEWIIAPFEDPRIGGVGTSQTVLSVGERFTIWEILAAFRISMRNIEITASTKIDGGLCCLSGRTAAYRTQIIKDPEFQSQFQHEYWLGKYHQHSGDDKFLTRWLYYHEWKTYCQTCPQVELASTFKDNWRFLKQLLRWTRNTWRSDFKSIFVERKIWRQYPYTAFTMIDKFFNPLTLLMGPVTITYFAVKRYTEPVNSNAKNPPLADWVIFTSYAVYLLITRFFKYAPHFIRRPIDVIFLPVVIIFNFYFALLKIYCLFTLHITEWGTRVGADHETAKSEDVTGGANAEQNTSTVTLPDGRKVTHGKLGGGSDNGQPMSHQQGPPQMQQRPMNQGPPPQQMMNGQGPIPQGRPGPQQPPMMMNQGQRPPMTQQQYQQHQQQLYQQQQYQQQLYQQQQRANQGQVSPSPVMHGKLAGN